jgi:endonuclease I
MNRYVLLVMSLLASPVVFSQGPNDTGTYYQAADGKRGAELKTALFQIISPHTVVSYTPGLWEAFKTIDIRDDGKIWEIYSAISNFIPGDDQDKGEEVDEGVCYNREHAFPKSWFNEDKSDTNYPMYTDLHHMFPSDRYVNTMRSNYPYGEVDKSLAPTKQSAEGFSKFGICDPSVGYTVVNGKARVFEPNDKYKGDLARAYFYMATAYESYKNGFGRERSTKNWSSPMLTSDIYPFFTDWAIRMLLRWADNDPVSEKELNRNEGIWSIQKNRNPFVDYPGLEQYIWGTYTNMTFSYDNYVKPETKGVSEIHKSPAPSANDKVYDLRGLRHDGRRLKKGVYIRRGKKVAVR